MDLKILADKVHRFVKLREWCLGHNPKNLAMAISVEAGELLEIFQWLTVEEAWGIAEDTEFKKKVEDEIGDVVILILSLGNCLGIDVGKSIDCKIKKNIKKYPEKEFRQKSSTNRPKPGLPKCRACSKSKRKT